MKLFPAAGLALAAALIASPALADDASTPPAAFQPCMACHSLDAGTHLFGPSLHALIGREAGSVESFPNYSAALKASEVIWDAETLDAYLADPQGYLPGNQMPYPAVADAAQRQAIVDYLVAVTQPETDAASTAEAAE